MKRWIAALLALMLLLSLCACGKQQLPETPAELLQTVWDGFEAGDGLEVVGGTGTNRKANEASEVELRDRKTVEALFRMPAETCLMVAEGASLLCEHNPLIFTAVCYRVQEEALTQDVVSALETALVGGSWETGLPDEVTIAVVDGQYVITLWGRSPLVSGFCDALSEAYGQAFSIVAQGGRKHL